MCPTTVVYIATSLDGYISREDGSIDWLVPFEDAQALQRFESFLSTVNAVVMGRNTFLHVLSFGQWPYHEIPVYVLSKSLNKLSESSPLTIHLRNCSPGELLAELSSTNFRRIYVDGGRTIIGFFDEDLIDELTITRIPIILGSGRTLFGPVPYDLKYQHVSTKVFPTGIVQTKYVRTSRT
jgi:dihydrofolate reductase